MSKADLRQDEKCMCNFTLDSRNIRVKEVIFPFFKFSIIFASFIWCSSFSLGEKTVCLSNNFNCLSWERVYIKLYFNNAKSSFLLDYCIVLNGNWHCSRNYRTEEGF